MFIYEINNLSEDLENKLSLYSDRDSKIESNLIFNSDKYNKYVDIIINPNDIDKLYMINRLENHYKNSIEIIDDKLQFSHSDISNISSKLYKTLYEQNNQNAFGLYIKIIRDRLTGDINWWLNIDFDDENVKNNFLDNATTYIIEHQNQNWVNEFRKIDYERYNWLPQIKIDQIPENFDNVSDLYFWLKENRNRECLDFIGSSFIRYLLNEVIRLENYNIYNLNKNRVLNILEACKDDYITIGYILTNDNIKLNSFFLKQFQYCPYAFLNLYNANISSHNITDYSIDYTKQWQEILANQLVNIFFKHFYNLQYRKQFSQIIFNLINYLTGQYAQQYNNIHHYKSNYTLSLVLEKLSSFEIKISQYEKTYFFDLIIEELVSVQLLDFKNKKEFDRKNYFLISYYLKQINIKRKITDEVYETLVLAITQAITNNLQEVFNNKSENNAIFIDYDFLEKIDFGLVYQLSLDKSQWLKILDIDLVKNGLNSGAMYVPSVIAQLYFKIMLNIFQSTQDSNIKQYINKLAIELGLEPKYSIFVNSTNKDRLYSEYLKVLNIFDEELFQEFSNALYEKHRLKGMLQLLTYTISESRQNAIKVKMIKMVASMSKENMHYSDMRDSIIYAIYNGQQLLASELIDAYKLKIEKTNYKHKEQEFYEIVYKKELLDIYNDEFSKDEKIKKLYQHKIPFDDKNFGTKSRQTKCENYRDYIRAIIFFEDEPIKTYKILLDLLEKEVDSLYLINMLNAYFKVYKNDKNKKEKFSYILEQYNIYANRLQSHKKSLFEYQVLFYGYLTAKDEKQFTQLWVEIPKEYQYDLKVFELRCEFLQDNNQSLAAKEYLKYFKTSHILNEDEKEKIIKIETELNSNIKIEVKNQLNVKIDFQSTSLTIQEAKNYWLQIKDMSDDDHANIFTKNNNLKEYIVNIMLHISKELLNRKINIQRQQEQKLEIEDIINDWVKSLLNQKMNFLHWKVLDQTRGGKSSSGKNVGERDLEIFNANNEKLFLFEAFRLFSSDTTKIKEHIHKLDGYNTDGCKTMIVMVYTEVIDFVNLCQSYQNFLKTFDYKGFDKLHSLHKHNFDEVESNSSTIKLLKETRYKNNKEIILYHYLLDFH